MRIARAAAEIDPVRAISSRSFTLPGPILAPDARSIRIAKRVSADLVFDRDGNSGILAPVHPTI